MEKLSPDIKQEVEWLLDASAGDSYEGWDGYWKEKPRFEERVYEVLKAWADYCEEYGG